MPRPLALIGFTVFFSLAIFMQLGWYAACAAVGLALLMFMLCCAVKRLRSSVYCISALSAAAAGLLFLGCMQFSYYPAMDLAGSTLPIRAQLADLPVYQYGKVYYTVKTQEINGEKQELKLRLVLVNPLDADLTDDISGTVTFYALGAHEAGSLKIYQSGNTYLGAYSMTEMQVTPKAQKSAWHRVLQLRAHILQGIDARVPGEAGGLVKALLLGERSGLSDKTRQVFSDTGVAHIVSVSGLHLAVWALFLFRICEALRLNRRVSALLSCGFILLFMALAGFNYAVVRSGLMMLMLMLGHVFAREADTLTNLSLALLVLCVQFPFSAGNTGLQLSAAATLGLILLQQKIERPVLERAQSCFGKHKWLYRPVKYLWSLTAATLAATLPTLPLIALTFGRIPLLAVPANIALLGASSLCMLLGGFVGLLPLSAAGNALASPLSALGALLSRYILRAAEWLGGLRWATVPADTPAMLLWLTAALALIGLALLLYRKSGKALTRLTALLCSGLFCIAAAADGFISAKTLELYLANSENGIILCLKQYQRGLLFLSGGEDSFFFLTDALRLLNRAQLQTLDALLLPRNTRAANETAAHLAASVRPAQVLAQRAAAPLDMLLPPESILVQSRRNFTALRDASVSFVGEETRGYAYIQSEAGTVLLLFYPGSDTAQIPEAWRSADIAVCRGTPPEGLDYSRFGLVVCVGGEKGRIERQILTASGARAVSAAETGTLQLTLRGGKLAARVLN